MIRSLFLATAVLILVAGSSFACIGMPNAAVVSGLKIHKEKLLAECQELKCRFEKNDKAFFPLAMDPRATVVVVPGEERSIVAVTLPDGNNVATFHWKFALLATITHLQDRGVAEVSDDDIRQAIDIVAPHSQAMKCGGLWSQQPSSMECSMGKLEAADCM